MARDTMLIVDDIEINRELLREIFEEQYKISEALDGEEALRYMYANKNHIAVVLLDIKMPKMNGITVLEEMRKHGISEKIPVVMITSFEQGELERQCYKLGIADYIVKPFDSFIVEKRVNNIVRMNRYMDSLQESIMKRNEDLRKHNEGMVEFLGNLVEFRNLDSGEHVQRIKQFSYILGKRLAEKYPKYGLDNRILGLLPYAAALHDIGKICIPDSILLKPARLTNDEFEMMKSHTTKGAELVTRIQLMNDEMFTKICYDVCRSHHERYDGKGYPDGLKGYEIPIAAQIVSIVDVYEALISPRVYKEAYSCDEAYIMIMTGECGVFSPELMECFSEVRKMFEEVL